VCEEQPAGCHIMWSEAYLGWILPGVYAYNMFVFLVLNFCHVGRLLSVSRAMRMCTNVVLVCFGFFSDHEII
jgi:hypothetical protein